MAELLLHIGMPRTGTSAIQEALWARRERLASLGVLYPELGLSGPTHAVFANVFKGPSWEAVLAGLRGPGAPAPDPYATGEDADELYGVLRALLEGTSARLVVLSSECFVEWIDPQAVADQLLPYGIRPRVVVYLRRQDLWIQSVYSQLVKDRFIRYTGQLRELPQCAVMDYCALLAPWAQAFGLENVIVRVYDRRILRGGGVVEDFLDLLGLSQDPLGVKVGPGDVNASLHREVVALLCRANGLALEQREHETLLEALRPVSRALVARDGVAGFEILDPAEREDLLRLYDESNAAVAREYLGRADGILFPA